MDKYQEGLKVFQEMMPHLASSGNDDEQSEQRFAPELGKLSIENVFGTLWTRSGLDRRARSLVTLGILIALRASNEMSIHFPIAIQNGLTREELEEVIYHSSAYAGFPAAAEASHIAEKVLNAKNHSKNQEI